MVNETNKKSAIRKRLASVFGKTRGEIAFHVVNYTVFTLIAFIMIYPFATVVVDSFTAYTNINGVLHARFSWGAYSYVLSQRQIYTSFLLTVGVVVGATLLHLAVTAMGAYALSKRYLKGRNLIHIFILITFLFSGGLIPGYLLIRNLGLMDNILVYILPGATSAYNLIIAKNFFLNIPDSLEESAKLDGAGHFRIFLSVYLPLSIPIMAVLALWVAVGKWNDWATAELYIRDPDKLLIQNILRSMLVSETSINDPLGNGRSDLFALADNIKMATIVISTIPVLLIYPFLQKYFIKGVLLGSVKE